MFGQTTTRLRTDCNRSWTKLTNRNRRKPVRENTVAFWWQDSDLVRQFNTAVCLHGHTMYSEECLDFLPRYLKLVPGVSQFVTSCQRRGSVDFARAHWTPPLTPSCALRLEQGQIAGLGLRPMVSLTDHDSIEAPIALHVTAPCEEVPISVEWTVPYHRAILHLGIHNLPPAEARRWMTLMASYTSAPDEIRLAPILSELSKLPDVLIVLNHPFWLEEGIEEADRSGAVDRLLRECAGCFHAFELNGTRKWHENAATIALARQYSRPVISGGDRHACEAAACLNLTNAPSFAGFVSEIRDGHSTVLFMPHYREPMALRNKQHRAVYAALPRTDGTAHSGDGMADSAPVPRVPGPRALDRSGVLPPRGRRRAAP